MNMILGEFCAKIGLHLKKEWKTSKIVQILGSFPHFCRFFNSSWILAQNTTKFISIEVFPFILHPTHPWIWLSSVLKELKTFLAVWEVQWVNSTYPQSKVWMWERQERVSFLICSTSTWKYCFTSYKDTDKSTLHRKWVHLLESYGVE